MASPAILATALVTILVTVLYFATGVIVGRMRYKHKIAAPACSGHPEFDRAFRVQMNTLEHLPILIPLLWLTALYFSPFPLIAPILGVVWIIGRILFIRGYLAAAEKRGTGFGICALAELWLLLLALTGVGMTWAAVG